MRRWAAVLVALFSMLGLGGCGWIRAAFHAESDERVYVADLTPSRAGARLSRLHPRYAMPGVPHWPGGPPPEPVRPADKVDPLIRRWLNDPIRRNMDAELLVTFRENLAVPPMDSLALSRSAGDTTVSVADSVRHDILKLRASDYHVLEDRLRTTYGAVGFPTWRSWLIRGVSIVVPLRRVGMLAQWSEVESIEPRFSGTGPPQGSPCPLPPPQDGVHDDFPCNDPLEARQAIGTDAYLAAGLNGVRIGLLDTGVYLGHPAFASSPRIPVIGTTTDPNQEWEEGAAPGADADTVGHGTAVAALLTGGPDDPNDRHRGYTQAMVEAYRIYRFPVVADPPIDRRAGVAALELASGNGDRVILVEAQEQAGPSSMLSEAADKAVGRGSVVVAPTGNDMPKDIGSPASARGVLSVGGYKILTKQIDEIARYETRPGHPQKPDVIAPTEVESATNYTASRPYKAFGATSGAGPGAAAAASLLWSSLEHQGAAIEPGHVMAGLIACADDGGLAADVPRNRRGAGCVRLPQQGYAWFGSVDLSRDPGEGARNVELAPTTGAAEAHSGTMPGGAAEPRRLDVAIWWPEGLAADTLGSSHRAHNFVSLTVRGPTGEKTASDAHNVWQRAGVSINSGSDHFTLHIAGSDLVARRQRVYWFAWAHP